METRKPAKIARRTDDQCNSPPVPGICYGGGDDRLSSLPDEILTDILSLMPTKYAAGTSVLCRRWRHLCTRISSVDFDNTLLHKPLSKQLACEYMPPDRAQKYLQGKLTRFAASLYRRRAISILSRIRHSRYLRFSRLIDHVLLDHENLNRVRRFRLHFRVRKLCPNLKPQLWFYWFEKVMSPSSCELEEFDVKIDGVFPELPDRMICIDECFYGLKNLRVMKLDGVIVETTPGGYAFLPSLKILQLSRVKTVDRAESVSRLVAACPVLETLHLENCCRLKSRMTTEKEKEKDMIVVSIPSLKNLTIIGCVGYDVTLVCPIVVEAPCLEHLHVQDFAEVRFVDSRLSCLVSARIDIGESRILDQCVIGFFAQISNAKEMHLSSRTMGLLSAVVEEEQDVQLPIFPNLTHLKLETVGSSCCVLHSLLNSASKLQSLVVHLGSDKEEAMKWESEPACTPKCLLSSLEEIELYDLVADENEMKMAAYLLKTGAVLKRRKVNNNTCLLPGDDGLDIKEDGDFTRLAQLLKLNLSRGSSSSGSSTCEAAGGHLFRRNDKVESNDDDDNVINFTDEVEYEADEIDSEEDNEVINVDDDYDESINVGDDYDFGAIDLLCLLKQSSIRTRRVQRERFHALERRRLERRRRLYAK